MRIKGKLPVYLPLDLSFSIHNTLFPNHKSEIVISACPTHLRQNASWAGEQIHPGGYGESRFFSFSG